MAVAVLGLLSLACRGAADGGGAQSGTASDETQAPQGSGVDTPPGMPAGADSAGRPAGGPSDTGTGGGRRGGPTGEGAREDAAPDGGAHETSEVEAGEGPASGQTSGDVMNGWKQYEANCSRCHGQDALGSAIAPDLRQSVKGTVNQAVFLQVVKDGRAEKGMPPFAELLAQQIQDIYAFIVARSTGKLGPGRPRG